MTFNRKLAIIGCGAVAEMFHIPTAVQLVGAANVSLVDSDSERLETIAETFGISSIAPDLCQLDADLHAALVATPPHTHACLAEAAFAQGLHVLCEKPLANTSADCRKILAASQESRKVLAVSHNYRFFDNRIGLREMILKGELGKIRRIEIQQGNPATWPTITGYSFRKEMVPGGILLNEGLHSLDFLFWLFGMPTLSDYIDDYLGGVESNAQIRMTFNGQIDALFRLSRTCTRPNTIRLAGDAKTAEIDIYGMRSIRLIDTRSETSIACGDGKSDFLSIARDQFLNFFASLDEGLPPMCSGEEGAAVVHFIEQCYAIKRNRPLPRRVPLPGYMW